MDQFGALILLFNTLIVLGQNGRGFIKTNVILFDVIQSSNEPKSLIECCGFCTILDSCQGVTFKDNTCTAINNVIPNFRARFDEVAWIDAELYKRTKKLLIFSGSKAQTEVIDLGFESSHVLPSTIVMGIGDKISDTEAMICESKFDNVGNCQYFPIARNQEATMLEKVYSEPRLFARAIGIPKLEGLLVVGGEGSSTSEIITKTGSQTGPPAPVADLQSSCMVRINSSTIFMIGGSSDWKKTWYCHHIESDPKDWKWINGPELKVGRVTHACVVWHVDEKIVAAAIGGEGAIDAADGVEGLKSTEFLDIGTNEWLYGPNLDVPTVFPGTTEISYNGLNEIFLFGGQRDRTGEKMNRIYKLKCGDQNQLSTCHWFRMAQSLQLRRRNGIVIQI